MNGARAYLASRGITPESIDRFKLGVDPDNNQLTIPYLSPAGPWLVKYRCLRDHDCKETGHARYFYDTGAGHHLYNASALLTADVAVVVEGELDAVTVTQVGLTAVAYPGTAAWKANPHWRWCFDSVDTIVVVADGDEAGRKAAAGVAESLRNSVNADVRTVILPDGEDSNSYLVNHGDYDYLERLELL